MPNDLTNLSVNEVSFCRRGMNKHARVALFKRDGADTEDENSNAVRRTMKAGISGDNPDNKGDPDMSADLEKKIGDLTTQLAEVTKKLADAETVVAAFKKAESLTPAEKEFAASLSDAQKGKFMAAEAGERKDMMSKRANDEVLKVGGAEIRKSDNPAMFEIVKAQQADIAKAREDVAKERDARELVEMTKRAEGEFGNLPGEPVAKAKVLKAVAAMPETERTELEKILKAANTAMKGVFKVVGADGEANGDPQEQIDALSKVYAEKNNVTFAKAQAAVLETAAGRELYKQIGKPKAA